MRHKNKLCLEICLISSVLLLGCSTASGNIEKAGIEQPLSDTSEEVLSTSNAEEETNPQSESSEDSYGEDAPAIATEVEGNSSYIIDSSGYRPKSRKVVYILAEGIDKKYSIVNVVSGRTVFANELKVVNSKRSDGRILYMGDFTDYVTKGTFRVFHEELGYSEAFVIDTNRFDEAFRDTYKEIEATEFACSNDLMYVLSNMLMTIDVYPEAFADMDYIETNIENLLNLQNESTGIVSSSMEKEEQSEAGEEIDDKDLEATAQFAGLMAQYSSIFAEVNPELANRCLNASSRAFALVERNKDRVESDLYYFSACQMYRLTGQYSYRSAIEWYDNPESSKTNYSRYNYIFAADLAYLKTNNRTDYERCQTLMKKYLTYAEKISGKVERENFFVQKDISSMSVNQILDNMQRLALISYVVSGYEYSGILENYAHYLSGVNEEGKEYLLYNIEESETKENETDEIQRTLKLSELLFPLGHLCNL